MRSTRFQVAEVKGGYAVRDTRNDKIWTKTYTSVGWAARAAIRLNQAHGNRRYF